MPEATQPVRCIFWVRTGAFYGQEATMPEGASYGQEGRMIEWSREILSLGVSTLIPSDTNQINLLNQADQALYRAKRDGKNRWAC